MICKKCKLGLHLVCPAYQTGVANRCTCQHKDTRDGLVRQEQ